MLVPLALSVDDIDVERVSGCPYGWMRRMWVRDFREGRAEMGGGQGVDGVQAAKRVRRHRSARGKRINE